MVPAPATWRVGSQILLRPICPTDEPMMTRFHESLSDRSVYMRYFASLSLCMRTAHDRLSRICHPDPDREIVVVASRLIPQSKQTEIVGVGRRSDFRQISTGRFGNPAGPGTHSPGAAGENCPYRRRDAPRQLRHADCAQACRFLRLWTKSSLVR